jgi:hypothetical protein
MNASTSAKPPTWFRAIVIAAIVWNLLGVAAYIMDVTRSEEALAGLPEAQRALYSSIPAWATGAYAIAVFAGLGGSVLLALRKALAAPVFGLSLAAVAVQMLHAFVLSDSLAVLGPASAIMPAVVTVIAAALIWFSLDARRRGWLA